MPRLTIPITSDEQLQHIRNAESELSKAGVEFDVGSDVDGGKILTREWELDQSLKGATIGKGWWVLTEYIG